MGRHGMGEFEQAVLLAIFRQRGSGYGVSIRQELSELLQRDVAFGAIYTTLDRLEKKGMVSSRLGEATQERGGRAKRLYRIEAPGQRALADARARSSALWGDEALA